MKLLDYIFKSKEQRELEAKEAEEKKDADLYHQADKLYKEKKYDECLKISMELVNKNFFGVGYWSVYLNAASILYHKGCYKEVIEVSKHYRWHCDRDSDNSMEWYVSYSKKALEEQNKPKTTPEPVQGKSQQIQKPSSHSKPATQQKQAGSPKLVVKPVAKPIVPAPPKQEVLVPKWDDDEEEETEDMKSFLPPARPRGSMEKASTMYWQFLQAKKGLPPFEMLGMTADLPQGAVAAINKIKAEAQNLLDRADAYMRQEDWHGAANLYENLLMNKYWEPEPYYALIEIYERLDRHRDAQAVREQGITTFNSIQRHMKSDLLEAARKIDAESLALDIIQKGEKVVYGLGLYTVYDPFPCIQQWEQELKLNS